MVVLAVYMLLYGERIGAVRARRGSRPATALPEDDFPTRVQGAVFGYVRGQFLFSLIMGTSAGVSLYILGSLGIFPEGKTYALAFGAFYGFAELIPYIGPAIGAFPPVMIALFSNEPIDALWLAIMFTALQQIEGHIVAPNVFGHALRINPLLVIFALLLGGQLYGFLGAFIALPIAAVLRGETVVYLRRHLTLEPWPRAPAVALAGVGTEAGARPECGAAVAAGREPLRGVRDRAGRRRRHRRRLLGRAVLGAALAVQPGRARVTSPSAHASPPVEPGARARRRSRTASPRRRCPAARRGSRSSAASSGRASRRARRRHAARRGGRRCPRGWGDHDLPRDRRRAPGSMLLEPRGRARPAGRRLIGPARSRPECPPTASASPAASTSSACTLTRVSSESPSCWYQARPVSAFARTSWRARRLALPV